MLGKYLNFIESFLLRGINGTSWWFTWCLKRIKQKIKLTSIYSSYWKRPDDLPVSLQFHWWALQRFLHSNWQLWMNNYLTMTLMYWAHRNKLYPEICWLARPNLHKKIISFIYSWIILRSDHQCGIKWVKSVDNKFSSKFLTLKKNSFLNSSTFGMSSCWINSIFRSAIFPNCQWIVDDKLLNILWNPSIY